MVECDQCDGTGEFTGGIADIKLDKSLDNYEELAELQKDAKRVIKQANTLAEINPARRGSYLDQLKGCLDSIDRQVEKLTEKK